MNIIIISLFILNNTVALDQPQKHASGWMYFTVFNPCPPQKLISDIKCLTGVRDGQGQQPQ